MDSVRGPGDRYVLDWRPTCRRPHQIQIQIQIRMRIQRQIRTCTCSCLFKNDLFLINYHGIHCEDSLNFANDLHGMTWNLILKFSNAKLSGWQTWIPLHEAPDNTRLQSDNVKGKDKCGTYNYTIIGYLIL